MPEQEKEKKKGSGRRTVFRVIVTVLMAVIILLLLLQRCERRPAAEEPDGLARSVKASLGQLEGKSEAEIQAELDRVIGEGMFHISINPDPVFRSGDAEGNLEIENVPNNRYTMRLEIILDDGTPVYDSGLIDPNYHVQRDNLSEVLAAGEYPATATFYAYDTETLDEMGSVSCRITIHILS